MTLRNPRRGLTLLDLVVTLLILGIVAALAIPRFGSAIESANADAAARQVASDLNYARTYARTHGRSQSVVFSVANDNYSLTGLNAWDRPAESYDIDLKARYVAKILSVSLGSGGGSDTVVFNLHGEPDFGGSVVIDVSGKQRTILIENQTGQVTIQP